MLGILKERVLWLLWDTSPAAGRRFMALVLCKLERSRSTIHPAHFCSSFLKMVQLQVEEQLQVRCC